MVGRPIPIYGSGNYRIQPVLIEDAVAVYSACLEKQGVWTKTFDLVGEDRIRFVDYIRLFAQKLGEEVRFIRIDLESALRDAMRQKSRRRFNPYLSVDELDVLISDFTSSPQKLKQSFSIRLTPLNEALEKIPQKIKKWLVAQPIVATHRTPCSTPLGTVKLVCVLPPATAPEQPTPWDPRGYSAVCSPFIGFPSEPLKSPNLEHLISGRIR